MVNYKDLLKSQGITDMSVLSKETKATISEYEKLNSSKLPTIRKNGELTPAAFEKLARLNRYIVNDIVEYVAERDAETDNYAEEERLRLEAEATEQARLKKEQEDKEDKEAAEQVAQAENNKKKSGLFSIFFGD